MNLEKLALVFAGALSLTGCLGATLRVDTSSRREIRYRAGDRAYVTSANVLIVPKGYRSLVVENDSRDESISLDVSREHHLVRDPRGDVYLMVTPLELISGSGVLPMDKNYPILPKGPIYHGKPQWVDIPGKPLLFSSVDERLAQGRESD